MKSHWNQSPAGKGTGRGVALITTLAILAILSVLLVAFVSMTTSDRQSTQSYSQSLRAEEIANGGLAQIVSQLRAEIADPLKSTNFISTNAGATSNTIYQPLNATNAVPQRMALGALADTNLAGIVKISIPGAAIYTASDNQGTNYASTAATTSVSLNGRHVSLARWMKPSLTGSLAAFPAPCWILVGRNGPIPAPTSGVPPSLSNANAPLGRYAYVVYDTSGLLDINVAGYSPSDYSNPPAKGFASWADLTQLGISSGDANTLVKWRNAQSSANYASYVTNAAAQGFLQVQSGDTAFLGRQELLKYAAQYPTVSNALPYLTTFSRELNGPVWAPSTNSGAAPYDYFTHRYGATTTVKTVNSTYGGGTVTTATTNYNNNVFILNPRILRAYTNSFGMVRNVGEPLVKYRFPLDKLALLEKMQGKGTLSTTDIDNIQKYFGLDIASDITATTGLYRHWNYPTTNSNYNYNLGAGSVTNRILTLDEVAKLQRDPNFFELLQAGILSGSLGKPGRGDYGAMPSYGASYPDSDANIGYQIVRIGANIIDQWDADSCPTTITFDRYNFYGIEDLPYINKLLIKCYSTANSRSTNGVINPLFYFEMWNPHQNLGNEASGSRPSNFRLAPYGGDNFFSGINVVQGTSTNGTTRWNQPTNNFSAVTNSGVMSFTANVADYREPSLIFSGSPTIDTAKLLNTNPVTAGPGSDRNKAIVGLTLPPFNLPAIGTTNNIGTREPWYPPGAGQWQYEITATAVYPLQYEWPVGSGTYHTYSTLSGLEMSPSAPSSDTISRWGLGIGCWTYSTSGTEANSYGYSKSDPRTTRWAASSTSYSVSAIANPLNAGNSLLPSSGSTALTYNQMYQTLPLNGASQSLPTAPGPYRADLWAANTNSIVYAPSVNPNYTDLDGTQRLGDSGYAGSAHLPFYGGDVSRPVILNRPFTSVADLGYAYRDVPWKTLNFFSSDSADSALLDLFTLSDGPVVAGQVNPNAAPVPVLEALLSGAPLDPNGTTRIPDTAALAAAFRSVATNTGFTSRADIVAKFMTNSEVGNVSANKLKTAREAVTRALAEPANTRTWNFMVDIIAQSGRYATPSAPLDNFVVEGERRYWLHIAIDRYTGQIVDQQLEIVNE